MEPLDSAYCGVTAHYRPFFVSAASVNEALAASRSGDKSALRLQKVTSLGVVAAGDCVVWRMGSHRDYHKGGLKGDYLSTTVQRVSKSGTPPARGWRSLPRTAELCDRLDSMGILNADGRSLARSVCVEGWFGQHHQRGCVFVFRRARAAT